MSEFDLKLVLVLELHQATASNPQAVLPDRSNVHVRRQRSAPYQKVRDERKHPIRGLWVPKIKRTHINHYIARPKGASLAARTVNLENTVLRNVPCKAIDARWINHLPTENLCPLKSTKRERDLVAAATIEKLCTVGFQTLFREGGLASPGQAGHPLVNARQFADYIRLMSCCGSRLSETVRLRWWSKRPPPPAASSWVANAACPPPRRSSAANIPLPMWIRAMPPRCIAPP